MRRIRLTIFLLPLLAACGGGSTPTLQAAALQGLVYEVDGQTLDRSGVLVRIQETGATAVTGPDGRFDFAGLPPGSLTLLFGNAALAAAPQQSGGMDDSGAMDNSSGDASGMDDSGGNDAPEMEDERDEDDNGNPRVVNVNPGESVEVRVAMNNGRAVELAVSRSDRRRTVVALARDPASPDGDVEGKVKVESRSDGDKIEFEVEHLAAGDVVEFFLEDPNGTDGPQSIGTATADASGEAHLELNQRHGDALPLGAASVSELVGFLIEVRLSGSGETLLTGEVPDLPSETPLDDGDPGMGEKARGKSRLDVMNGLTEAKVEIRRRDDGIRQRFKVEVEGLEPGDRIAIEVEDPDNAGSFVRLGTATADSDGEAEFELRTEGGDTLPFGAADVSELEGLGVRVILDDGSDTLLATGTIPPLVSD